MAHVTTIRRALKKYAAHYKRGQNYADIMEEDWVKALRHTPDKLLDDALTEMFKQEFPYKDPNLSNLMDQVKYLGKGAHLRKGPQKCIDCRKHGFREMAIHFRDHAGTYRVQKWSVSCNCDLGKRNTAGCYIDIENEWKNRKGFIRSYISSAELPWLGSRETMSPEEYEALVERRKDSRFRRRAHAFVSRAEPLPKPPMTWVEQQQQLKEKQRKYREKK
jgi:hypothetical protein